MSNRDSKPMLSASVLVKNMRDFKGIQFVEMTEIDAESYLIEKNNYLRTASYRKLYDKYASGVNKGKYMHLDFAYLVELSTIDMRLRYLIEKMCLDIEHALGVRLLNLIEANPNEDGYNIVANFLAHDPQVVNTISRSVTSPYVRDLAQKYLTLEQIDDSTGRKQTVIKGFDDCPAWVLIEMLSFGDVIRFYDYYCQSSGHKSFPVAVLNLVRSLRNAVAHNNCILIYLKTGICYPQQDVLKAIKEIPGINKSQIQKRLTSRTMQEFVALLWVYRTLVSQDIMRHRVQELNDLFSGRMLAKQDYFTSNPKIVSSYRFAVSVINGFFNTPDS